MHQTALEYGSTCVVARLHAEVEVRIGLHKAKAQKTDGYTAPPAPPATTAAEASLLGPARKQATMRSYRTTVVVVAARHTR